MPARGRKAYRALDQNPLDRLIELRLEKPLTGGKCFLAVVSTMYAVQESGPWSTLLRRGFLDRFPISHHLKHLDNYLFVYFTINVY
jgi:hypothetical protein